MKNYADLRPLRSDEVCRKISEAHKGRKHSEEHRRKNSEAKKGQEPWNKGKKTGPRTDAKYCFEGKPLGTWVELLGVGYSSLKEHLQTYGDLSHCEAYREYAGLPSLTKHLGRTRSEWAELLGVTIHSVDYHLKKHGDLTRCKKWRSELGVDNSPF